MKAPGHEQPELRFGRKPAAPARRRADELVAALRGRGWVNARELRALGFTDRALRSIAETDERVLVFSFPGAPGYKLMEDVTLQEFRQGIAALWSQIKLMMRRVRRYLTAWRRLGRPA